VHVVSLRQYLMKHVLPLVTEGLLEVSRVEPSDPIDYLAEYLFKNAPKEPVPPPPKVERRPKKEKVPLEGKGEEEEAEEEGGVKVEGGDAVESKDE
jgi:hypothetical protein